ncbi:MAG: PAS domain-containing protein [Candidatus Acidiferrales bacterium]
MEKTQHKWVNEMKAVLETLNQGVIINDDRKRIVFANRLFLRMIGIPAEELLGVAITDLYPPEDAAVLQKHIESE